MNYNLLICSLFLAYIAPMILHDHVAYASHPKSAIDEITLKILDECAEKNTSPLKGKGSNQSIARFKNYIHQNSGRIGQLACGLFTFTPSKTPKEQDSKEQGIWTAEQLSGYCKRYRIDPFLNWLKKNYTPQSEFSFLCLLEEPYCGTWYIEQQVQDELSELLDTCPLLTSCNHPDLPWTKKCILIPDFNILYSGFHQEIGNLLSAEIYPSKEHLSASVKKGFVSFTQRDAKLYFRGALTGAKRPFSLENISQNPRHYALTLLPIYPYMDFKITSFMEVCKIASESPFYEYLFQNFSHLITEQVDFFEHGKYKYLLSCDGFGAAWGRPQLIMATGSVLFMNAQCEQYFYSLMKAGQTYIVINKDFSNLDAEFKRLEALPDLAEKIGLQGKQFVHQFCTEPAIDAYLWLVLNKLENQFN